MPSVKDNKPPTYRNFNEILERENDATKHFLNIGGIQPSQDDIFQRSRDKSYDFMRRATVLMAVSGIEEDPNNRIKFSDSKKDVPLSHILVNSHVLMEVDEDAKEQFNKFMYGSANGKQDTISVLNVQSGITCLEQSRKSGSLGAYRTRSTHDIVKKDGVIREIVHPIGYGSKLPKAPSFSPLKSMKKMLGYEAREFPKTIAEQPNFVQMQVGVSANKIGEKVNGIMVDTDGRSGIAHIMEKKFDDGSLGVYYNMETAAYGSGVQGVYGNHNVFTHNNGSNNAGVPKSSKAIEQNIPAGDGEDANKRIIDTYNIPNKHVRVHITKEVMNDITMHFGHTGEYISVASASNAEHVHLNNINNNLLNKIIKTPIRHRFDLDTEEIVKINEQPNQDIKTEIDDKGSFKPAPKGAFDSIVVDLEMPQQLNSTRFKLGENESIQFSRSNTVDNLVNDVSSLNIDKEDNITKNLSERDKEMVENIKENINPNKKRSREEDLENTSINIEAPPLKKMRTEGMQL